MASRKKQDEKNVKTLRDLAAISTNKYCFECNQRGPTYVDVTIGSFVCTKCSGLLRGLTPPHRVKSISMATFSQDEINLLEKKGNEVCRATWLALYEGPTLSNDTRDEQTIKDFMANKYEKKRYYIEQQTQAAEPPKINNNKMPPSDPKPILTKKYLNNTQTNNRRRPEVSHRSPQTSTTAPATNGADFVANFDTADIFSVQSDISNGNRSANGASPAILPQGFADFDNNPVFANAATPKNGFTTLSFADQQNHQVSHNVPSEDRYAALKDLDNALKSQSALDWSSGSNGSLYSTPTPTGSTYSNSSPQSSAFGSPIQSQFLNSFETNPFGNNGFAWTNGHSNNVHNPFRAAETNKMNGFATLPEHTAVFNGTGDSGWIANPFKFGGSNSNNPFL